MFWQFLCSPYFLQDYEIDFISLSYTRSVDDVVEARAFLDAVGLQNTKIFAKLESRQSLLNFKGILNEADGIIISRWGGGVGWLASGCVCGGNAAAAGLNVCWGPDLNRLCCGQKGSGCSRACKALCAASVQMDTFVSFIVLYRCRGNLGLDCLPEKMALVQKNLIQSCNLVSRQQQQQHGGAGRKCQHTTLPCWDGGVPGRQPRQTAL